MGDYVIVLNSDKSHHLGLDVHDVGNFDCEIEVGNVFTVEPGIYIKEESLGIRLEDDILIGEKENINLKYILNTHHHFDHIGGNIDLKKKYNSIVVGYKDDAHRIPEIDFLVEDNQIWKAENFEAKIMYIPGHTIGHISFYFFKEKLIFTGDTLFSLGCGRIFEGTYLQMHKSLNFFKSLINQRSFE